MENQLARLKILIADDDLIAQICLKNLFADLGCDVDVVGNGKEALDFISKRIVDIILTDINMPKIDGFELTKKIRASKDTFNNTPIIGVTADDSIETKQSAKNVGMDYLITKPIDMADLKSILEKLSIKAIEGQIVA